MGSKIREPPLERHNEGLTCFYESLYWQSRVNYRFFGLNVTKFLMYVGISFIKATETMNIKAFGRKTHKKMHI